MSQIKATFSGKVVAEPEFREVAGNPIQEFPVYVNHTKKNSATGEYEPTGDTSKIRVTLWRDLAQSDVQKGDIVEIAGTLVEKEWEKQDGTTGRSLQTGFVDSIVTKWRAEAETSGASGF